LVKAHRQGLRVHISQARFQHPAHGRKVDIEGLTLNNVTHPVVCAVAPMGVSALERAHPDARAAVDGLDNDVTVVVHQAEGVAEPEMAATHLAQQIELLLPVSVA
jgi:hypothetical protein